jgi:hypothetical protein
MSNWHGKMGKGAARLVREAKRERAQARQGDALHERTKRHRVALEKLGECPDCGATA